MTSPLTNLYVRNIPLDWTSADLIKVGEKHGPIISAKIMYNPETTASRGMGFLRYAEHHDATLAIAGLNGYIPENATNGKPLNVQFAKDQMVGKGDGGSRYAPYPAKPPPRSGYPPSASSSAYSSPSHSSDELPTAPEGTDPLNVYVVDLPLDFTKEQFQALYEPFGNLVSTTVLIDPVSNISRGIGFARYSQRANAAKALKETQAMMLPNATKPLLVRFARETSRKFEEQTHATMAGLGSFAQQYAYYPYGAYGAAAPGAASYPGWGGDAQTAAAAYDPAAYQQWLTQYYQYYYPGQPVPDASTYAAYAQTAGSTPYGSYPPYAQTSGYPYQSYYGQGEASANTRGGDYTQAAATTGSTQANHTGNSTDPAQTNTTSSNAESASQSLGTAVNGSAPSRSPSTSNPAPSSSSSSSAASLSTQSLPPATTEGQALS